MEVIELFSSYGADLFQPNRLGETSLHILAAMLGEDEAEILCLILSGKGPVPYLNYRNYYSDTALIVAVIYNHFETVRMLLRVGVDSNIKRDNGMLAAQYAL